MKFLCRRCWSSYSSQNVSIKLKQPCDQQDIASITTLNGSHKSWTKYFRENLLIFKCYADFEADIEIENASKSNKLTIIFKQNPINLGYFILSELNGVLRSCY